MTIRPRHGAGAVVLAAVLVATASGLPYLRLRLPPVPRPGGTIARGVLHVHLPNDAATLRQMVGAARNHQLDFILFTSPGGVDAAGEGREGYYTVHTPDGSDSKPVLVLIAAEIATDRGNLAVASGSTDVSLPLTRRSSLLVAAARETGGFTLALGPCAAGPLEGAMPSPSRPDPPRGISGVEALSLASSFQPETYFPLVVAAALAPFNLDAALASMAETWHPDRDLPADLAWSGPAAPVGGIAREPGRSWGDSLPAFTQALRWVTTRLVLDHPLGRRSGTFAEDRAAVLAALRNGRSLAAVEAWGDPGRFHLISTRHGVRAAASDPRQSWIVLRQNGRIRASGPGPVLEADSAETDPWRAEVYLRRRDIGLPGSGWLLWIVAGEGGAP